MTGGERHLPEMSCFSIEVKDIAFHVPPIKWKGDISGHIGINDVFFYVLYSNFPHAFIRRRHPFFLVSFIRILYYKSDRSGTPSTRKKRRTT